MGALTKNFKSIAGVLIVALFAWYFANLFVFICVSIVITIIGRPLVRKFSALKIKNIQLGNSVGAIATILVILSVIALFFIFLAPLIVKQANLIVNIDTQLLTNYYQGFITDLNVYLFDMGFIKSDEDVLVMLQNQLSGLVSFSFISVAFKKLVSATGSLFMASSIILFLSFFFLREPQLIRNFVLWITPSNHQHNALTIMYNSRRLLSRYFVGVLIEIFTMMILISGILGILGINNAILIGFMGGLMNVIPYIGPLIGIAIGTLMGIIYVLSIGDYGALFFNIFSIAGAFIFSNMIDNFLLQPIIYSKSVRAHPIEIFLVIIMAGNLAGILGMMAAIPVYTIIKVIYLQLSLKMGEETTQSTNLT
ncbi:MAG: AI-2E family transporter [Bacteroidales bacterium]|nr:AI-2E family transporter [Bacteroidales bacterium]